MLVFLTLLDRSIVSELSAFPFEQQYNSIQNKSLLDVFIVKQRATDDVWQRADLREWDDLFTKLFIHRIRSDASLRNDPNRLFLSNWVADEPTAPTDLQLFSIDVKNQWNGNRHFSASV